MKLFPVLLLSFLLLFFVGLVGAGDETWINEELKNSNIEVYTLSAGTYTISDKIIIPDGKTLQGAVSESGELLTKIMLESDSTLGKQVPLILMKSHSKLLYIDVDGNSENQNKVPTHNNKMGNGYHNLIGAYYEDDIEIAYCNLHNNLNDGARLRSCTNVKYHDNTASKSGHDELFVIQCEGVQAYNNTMEPRNNAAFRSMSSTKVAIFNNTIVFNGDHAGPAIQIQNDAGIMENIEVCGNYIYGSWGPAFWLVDKTKNSDSNILIHHNVIENAGQTPNYYWVGGIISSGVDFSAYDNVWDGCYLAGVSFWAYSSSWATTAEATLKNNIFIDSIKNGYSNTGGWGLNNEISKQSVISSENCFYNNEGGNTRDCSVSSSDYYTNPKTSQTLCAIKWNGERWVIPGVSPRELGSASGVYDNATEITDEEIEQNEWDYFVSIFNTETSETGYIDQGNIKAVNPEWQQSGIAKAYIYLAGYKGKITIDNTSYIPENASSCAIVLTNTKNLADRPTDQTSTLNLYDGPDNILLAVLEVETFYEVKDYKTITILGQSIDVPYWKEKSKNATFSQTFDAPAIFPAVKPPKCYVRHYNGSHAIVIIPDNPGIVKTEIFMNNCSSREYRLIGEIGTAENGFKSTHFTSVSTWKFTGSQMSKGSDGLYITEPFDIDNLTIEITTPYQTMEVTDIEYIVIEDTSTKIFNLGYLTLLALTMTYGRAIYNIFKRELKRWFKKL